MSGSHNTGEERAIERESAHDIGHETVAAAMKGGGLAAGRRLTGRVGCARVGGREKLRWERLPAVLQRTHVVRRHVLQAVHAEHVFAGQLLKARQLLRLAAFGLATSGAS